MTNEEKLSGLIEALLARNGRALVAIDGMSASGKTTLAAALAQRFLANVLHMDDFFLPVPARQPGWEQIPAGNMDLERFRQGALTPAVKGEAVLYRPYICREGRFAPPRLLPATPLTVVEGAYCMHPGLGRPYALSVFMQIDPSLQRSRILTRNGPEGLARFERTWIPMEHRYFEAFGIPSACDLILTE